MWVIKQTVQTLWPTSIGDIGTFLSAIQSSQFPWLSSLLYKCILSEFYIGFNIFLSLASNAFELFSAETGSEAEAV